MELQNIRARIDRLDSKILKLLNERMEQAIMARKFKSKIEDTDREKELLEKLKQNARGLINPDFCVNLYREIITESKRLQSLEYKVMGFQGEHGAFSEMAAKYWNAGNPAVPASEFSDVFAGVMTGLYDYGIVPVENTLGGNVGQVNDLLIDTEVFISGAVDMPIHHCLLALPGTEFGEIREAYSHPQALAQCRHFLRENKIEPVPFYDTAGSAAMILEKKPKGGAAIAGVLAAELYGLGVLKKNIEDLDSNRTRFLVISKDKNSSAGNKCSINFNTSHKAGSLFRILEIFAAAGINLTRIESIPSKPGEYTFFIDFAGNENDPSVIEAMGKAKQNTSGFRLMGCYNEIVIP